MLDLEVSYKSIQSSKTPILSQAQIQTQHKAFTTPHKFLNLATKTMISTARFSFFQILSQSPSNSHPTQNFHLFSQLGFQKNLFYFYFYFSFALCFSVSHEFHELGRFLRFLCESALKAMYQALILCGNALQYPLLALFRSFQMVVLVLCAFLMVWMCLVQPFLYLRECSSEFCAPLLVTPL